MQIIVTEMNESDEINIRTQRSDYRFRLTDPFKCKGLLSGGRLGDKNHEAVFLGGLSAANTGSGEPSRLETGRRAVFFIDGASFDRLTTSIITEIKMAEAVAENC